ncbi:MAG: hypothetical protein PHC92_05205 [Syntrophomonadaceae bacterium]|nr:hypothetical protein [Syntrophomonadaceae bacterium]MDD3023358.1 hypothetical protein [Syntrophomonadaceae bacterium]
MTQMLKALYNDLLKQVSVLESCKKEISSEILITRKGKVRLPLIYTFLSYDLDKHELLEHATVLALSNFEENIIEDLQKLYSHHEGEELIDKIRAEIKMIKKFMQTINKAIKYPDAISFYERRMIQEISKYVVEQARLYNVL